MRTKEKVYQTRIGVRRLIGIGEVNESILIIGDILGKYTEGHDEEKKDLSTVDLTNVD
jgi:hypothetical protein